MKEQEDKFTVRVVGMVDPATDAWINQECRRVGVKRSTLLRIMIQDYANMRGDETEKENQIIIKNKN